VIKFIGWASSYLVPHTNLRCAINKVFK
jgi:hypothetical protein